MAVTVDQVKQKLELKCLTKKCENGEVAGGYVCDLLSWVMAKGREGTAWITVQTHLNIVAVACLHDFSCVIIPEGISVPQETLDKADEEGIPVFSSAKTAYELVGALYEMGVKA